MKNILKALEVKMYPQEYQTYLESELELIKNIVKNKKVIEIGCGDGRITPIVAKLAKQYTGIDINKDLLRTAKIKTSSLPNSKIIECNAENLDSVFQKGEFDISLCIWNTLGCMKNPSKVLEQINFVTNDKCLLTLMAKGTLETREKYYQMLNIDYKINPQTESIYSDVWGISRAFSIAHVRRMCNKVGFKIDETGMINNLAYYFVISKGDVKCRD